MTVATDTLDDLLHRVAAMTDTQRHTLGHTSPVCTACYRLVGLTLRGLCWWCRDLTRHCKRDPVARGMCPYHYKRMRNERRRP